MGALIRQTTIKENTMLRFLRFTTVVTMTVIMAAGCSGQKIQTLKEAICCDGGYEYRYADRFGAEKAAADREARLAALERDRQRLSDELAASKRETAALSGQVKSYEGQLAERDRELTSLRASASDSAQLASRLSSAQGESQRLAAELAASQAAVATLQAGTGDKDNLAAELAATQASLAALQAGASDKDKLASQLAAAKQRNVELETQLAAAQGSGTGANQRVAELEKLLAARDKELAGLRGDLSAEMAKLKDAQRGVIRALRPQIEKGAIMVDLNNERLLINLASRYLFGSGEDQLKPA